MCGAAPPHGVRVHSPDVWTCNPVCLMRWCLDEGLHTERIYRRLGVQTDGEATDVLRLLWPQRHSDDAAIDAAIAELRADENSGPPAR